MSESVTIKKSVELSGDVDVEVNIYVVKCYCGKKLGFSAEADSDGDIRIEVDEHECIQRDPA